jgi:hypothetical protein
MANVDNPNGATPVKFVNGAPYNGSVTKYKAAANLFKGDLVKLDGADGDGYASAARATAGAAMVGAVVGWEADPDNLSLPYCASGNTVYVADGPDLVFEMQQNATHIVDASVGLNVPIIVAAGSTASGQSNYELDSSLLATTSTLDMMILGIVDRPKNDRTAANSNILVKINRHQLSGTLAASGRTGV